MNAKTKASIFRHINDHIVWMCPRDENERCPDCDSAASAWEALLRELRPTPRKPKSRKGVKK